MFYKLKLKLIAYICIYSESIGEINGCRIVDIGYVFSQILDCTHEGMFECNFMNMEYVSEFRRGYYSQFLFKCKVCNIQKKYIFFKIWWKSSKAMVNK